MGHVLRERERERERERKYYAHRQDGFGQLAVYTVCSIQMYKYVQVY